MSEKSLIRVVVLLVAVFVCTALGHKAYTYVFEDNPGVQAQLQALDEDLQSMRLNPEDHPYTDRVEPALSKLRLCAVLVDLEPEEDIDNHCKNYLDKHLSP